MMKLLEEMKSNVIFLIVYFWCGIVFIVCGIYLVKKIWFNLRDICYVEK